MPTDAERGPIMQEEPAVDDLIIEALIVLGRDAAHMALPAHVAVRHRLPPRLVVVAATRRDLEGLRDTPNVDEIYVDRAPADALTHLDASERLFAKAWNERIPAKSRKGDGLPWDAPGFDAP